MAACDQPAELREIVTDREPKSKEQWFKSLEATVDSKASPREPKIQRVARMLRENESNKDCFEPIFVSIGPYHRANKDLEQGEKLKVSMAWKYMNGVQGWTKEELYAEVENVAAEARECYAADATEGMGNEEFTRMMFLDGCFFLQFIGGDDQMMKKHDLSCAGRDLFLLENQLPFIVLKALSKSSDPVERMKNLIDWWTNPQAGEEQSNAKKLVKKMVNFIRHPCPTWCYPKLKKEQSKAEVEPIIHLLQLLRKSFIDPKDRQDQSNGQGDGGRLTTYRSANELKKVGISFRRSQSLRFTDVGFSANISSLGIQGELRLPLMCVHEWTKSLLLNLVAYEMCPDVPEEDADVASYIWFLDNLIDREEDVKELRSHGILLNYLGSDKQVADLFNNISDKLVWNYTAYEAVNKQIENYCKNTVRIWVWERLSTHFKAPWSVTSFFAALIALVLTFIQTYYAVMRD